MRLLQVVRGTTALSAASTEQLELNAWTIGATRTLTLHSVTGTNTYTHTMASTGMTWRMPEHMPSATSTEHVVQQPLLLKRDTTQPSSEQRGMKGGRTWKVTAEKRPRHMNWEMLTKTATVHESTRKNSAGAFISYDRIQFCVIAISTKGPTARRVHP